MTAVSVVRALLVTRARAGTRLRSLRLVSRGPLAFGAEFLALLALKPLGVGFLRAFERGRGARFLGFLFRGASRARRPRDVPVRRRSEIFQGKRRQGADAHLRRS